MKVFSVDESRVASCIKVDTDPYPHIVLGKGGHKRAFWMGLGKWDLPKILSYGTAGPDGHMYSEEEAGELTGIASPCVRNVSVKALMDEARNPTGKFLIVAPEKHDNRALVLWRVPSGYRGSANISGEGVLIIARESSWHSGRGALGETAEVLAILGPGQELRAQRSGRRLQGIRGKLAYDGNTVTVIFGGEELESATSDEVHGEYV